MELSNVEVGPNQGLVPAVQSLLEGHCQACFCTVSDCSHCSGIGGRWQVGKALEGQLDKLIYLYDEGKFALDACLMRPLFLGNSSSSEKNPLGAHSASLTRALLFRRMKLTHLMSGSKSGRLGS